MSFCPLHNHSEYSALDGLSTTLEIAKRAQQLEYPYIGITDHGTVAGHLDFGKTMQEHGIKPIFGCELYHGVKERSELKKQRDQSHLVAGALTNEGLKNLWRLADSGATKDRFYHVPRVSWDALDKYKEGLFVTSACMLSLTVKELQEGSLDSLNRYIEIFKDNFYIELHTYPGEDQERINRELVQIAEEKGLPMTIATDAHFASPDQYDIHDAYMAIQTRDNIYMEPSERSMWHPKALYIKSVEEIKQDLSYLPEAVIEEALATNVAIGEAASAELPGIRRHLPLFVPKDCSWLDKSDQQKSASEVFIDLVEQGLVDRYGADAPQEVWDRAEMEMEVFLKAGLEHFFLQTWDFCRYCDNHAIIRGPGRGSVGGAIVAYALRITDIDPLYYGLKFERFYNPGREKGLPDIDNDFPRARRDEVKKYLAERWGKNRVRSIGTIGRLKPLAACNATWIGCGIEFTENEALKKIIEKVPDLEIHGNETIGWDEDVDPGKTIYVMDHVGDEIKNWAKSVPSRTKVRERWLEILRVVNSRVEKYGVHPSGVVVSDVDLADELPCRWAADPKIPVTMFPMDDVDRRQFVKQDILGLRNLDTLQEWEAGYAGDVEWSGLEREDHPVEMWEMLDKGLTLGIFQIEEGFGRQLCKRMKPRSIDDLGAIVAINRPGPIKYADQFIARRNGDEEIIYDHPILETILEPTYGIFLYQEQVIDYMAAIGYNPSDADAIRKILGKKKPVEMRALGLGVGEWKGKGYMQMATTAGIDDASAQKIWDKLERFASYSFNKSHAYEYALLTFRTLYAKFMDPPLFIISLLNTNPKKAGQYVSEARRMNITIKAPEIDRSGVGVEVHEGDILFGFSNIKHIGVDTAKYICKLRETYDLTSPEKMYEALETETALHVAIDIEKRPKRSPKQRLRSNCFEVMYNAGCWDNYEKREVPLVRRQKMEKELLQVILTDDTAQIFDNHFDQIDNCNLYDDINNGHPDLRLPGVVTGIKETKTKKDRKPMGIITIEYEGEEAEFVVFPQQWAGYSFLWKDRTPGIFELRETERGLSFASGIKLS